MSPQSSIFTPRAKHALLSMESSEDRVETILFLLQTAIEDEGNNGVLPLIRCSDVRTAHLMMEMRLHLLDGFD
jgi:hypothetical protein